MPGEAAGGTLFVVATPIGNLDDLTHRAARALRDADVIAAEDTRRTRALLTHLAISGKQVVKHDAHASDRATDALVERLVRGESIALVTDAGTPAVSDPGGDLVRRAGAASVRVVPIPGPSAVTTAIAASGLVRGPFFFAAFLPRSGPKRRRAIARIAKADEPAVLFEAPQRAAATLRDLAAAMPDRAACVARELTKLHEEILRGTLAELGAEERRWRGEVTIVVGPAERDASNAEMDGEPERSPEEAAADVEARIAKALSDGVPTAAIAKRLARELGLPRKEAYERVVRAKGAAR